MMSYLRALCLGKTTLKPQIVIAPLAATLILYALLPLRKNIAIADVATDRRLPAAARESRVLGQGRAAETGGPKAQIEPNQTAIARGQKVTFTSHSTADPDVPIIALQWNGPGRQNSRGNQFVVETAKLQPGNYEVRLTVVDQHKRQNQAVATLVVKPSRSPDIGNGNGTSDGVGGSEWRRPTAKINPNPEKVTQGTHARFVSNSRPSDTRANIIRHFWTTQWGQRSEGHVLDIDTNLLRPGMYWVRLEVTDQRELRATDTATLFVVKRPDPSQSTDVSHPTPPRPDPPRPSDVHWDDPKSPQRPIATITPKLPEINQGENVFFDGRQSRDPDGQIVRWSWQVDSEPWTNGSSAELKTHNLSPGKHRVSLEVTDNQGFTAMDSATLLVKEPKKDVDVALMELEVSPQQTTPNRLVQITAIVANNGPTSLRNLKVRFEIDGAVLTEEPVPSLRQEEKRAVKTTWVATTPGEHIVAAKIDPDDPLHDRNRTNDSRTRAVMVRSQAVVTISPNPRQVTQGEKVEFISHVAFPKGYSDPRLSYLWHGPGARVGHGTFFQLDTTDIPTGEHQINLEVSDGQSSIGTASARLVVSGRRLAVWLTTETQDPDTGQTIKFTGGTSPNFSDTEYKFFFGDNKQTDWSNTPEATHSYEEPRNYTVQILARRAGVTIGQTSAEIRVKDAPYSVILTSEPENVRANNLVTFTAHVEPSVRDVEYQFRFGDGEKTPWTPAATTSRSFPRDGIYTATAAIRIRGTRVVESAVTSIRVSAPPYSVWLWLALLGFAAIAAAATTYIRLKLVNVSVVPRVDRASLTVASSGKIDSSCEIGVRAARGEYKAVIEVDGALINS